MQTIVMLHGALGSAQDLNPLAKALEDKETRVLTFNFSGHGGSPFKNTFGIGGFTDELHHFLQQNGIEQAHLFGYSMGGYVALNYALSQSQSIGKLITLGTKFNWSSETVDKETRLLNPDIMLEKVPAFANALELKHGSNWKELVTNTADLMREINRLDFLNAGNLATLQTRVLLGLGDKDNMVSLDETLAVYKTIPKAQLYILPGTRHQIESVNASLLAVLIKEFLKAT